MSRTLIKNATCVLPQSIEKMDVLLDDGKLRLAPPKTVKVNDIIDARRMHLIPGVIDDQVHFREPGLTHKEDLQTGSWACAKGGVTTFLEMPNTNPATITQERLDEKLALAASKSVVNFGFYIGATPENVKTLSTVQKTPGIKIFIGSSTGNLLVDEQTALERIFAETTLPICAHCEDETTVRENRERLCDLHSHIQHSQVRDHRAAYIATKRAIDLAHKYNHRFHVLHVSTGAELELIDDHRKLITAEVCPHHLLFHTGDYQSMGSLVQMNPSIKNATDNEQLWSALSDGRIQVIATDHAPHTLEEKNQPYPQSPSGLPAVENSLALMLTAVNEGKLTLRQVVDAMCDAPARVWDIVNKGRLQEGYDADVVLIDLERTELIRNQDQLTKSKWSPWHGTEVTGVPVMTWVGGKLVYAQEKVDESVRGTAAEYDHARGGYWETMPEPVPADSGETSEESATPVE